MRVRLSIAPMMDVTNTHFRHFMRLLTRHTTLYTEMVHCNAVLNNHQNVLAYDQGQHPVVLQLGGSDPQKLALAAEIGVKLYEYGQVNLNVGCPSKRVQAGSFGACLMKEPSLVYQCVQAIKQKIGPVPVTIKCRLGVDELDSYQFLAGFIAETSAHGHVRHYIVHARKALLSGLSPAQNRTIPPLMYQRVYRLAQDFPHLQFTLNGGIGSLEQAQTLLNQHNIQGCMLGRTAMYNPYEFAKTDALIYQDSYKAMSRLQAVEKYTEYLEDKWKYESRTVLLRPIVNLYHGVIGCTKYRKVLGDYGRINHIKLGELVKEAQGHVQPIRLQEESKTQGLAQ